MDHASTKSSQGRPRQTPGLDARRQDASLRVHRTGDTLGLRAFEKISAVEGIHLSDGMRRDLESLDAQGMDEGERSRFIIGKYGKP